jgi:hypothetical protein
MAIELSNLTFTDGDDIVPVSGLEQIFNSGIANTLAGNDIIIGTSSSSDFNTIGINNYSGVINTGDGNDILIGTTTGVFGYGIQNYTPNINTIDATINTGAGKDTIIAIGPTYGIYNFNTIETGADDDKILAIGGEYGILNAGIIDTGDGKDSIIAYGGFSGTGSVFLGNDRDYLKGFGSGNFNGGNGNDVLELTSGSYTIGISPAGANFAKDGIIMNTVGFEKLIVGKTSYDFTSLTEGQTIIVA